MNRPYRRSTELAAYLYRADLYCPTCLIDAMIVARDAAPVGFRSFAVLLRGRQRLGVHPRRR